MSNLEATLKVLEDHKLEDIAYLDVSGASSLFDYMVVCTARSSQHAKTAADKILYHFKPNMKEIPRSDGHSDGGWIAVDLEDVVLHIMLAEERSKYSIEELWRELKKLHDAADN